MCPSTLRIQGMSADTALEVDHRGGERIEGLVAGRADVGLADIEQH